MHLSLRSNYHNFFVVIFSVEVAGVMLFTFKVAFIDLLLCILYVVKLSVVML
jgi:hypothetical protein